MNGVNLKPSNPSPFKLCSTAAHHASFKFVLALRIKALFAENVAAAAAGCCLLDFHDHIKTYGTLCQPLDFLDLFMGFRVCLSHIYIIYIQVYRLFGPSSLFPIFFGLFYKIEHFLSVLEYFYEDFVNSCLWLVFLATGLFSLFRFPFSLAPCLHRL